MQIRILHVVDTMLGMGGMEKNVVNLIQRMDPERFTHVVCVIRSLGSMADDIPASRGKVVCLGKDQPGRAFIAGMLARQIRETKPHIVHSRNWGAIEAVIASKWAARTSGVIHSEHGLDGAASSREPLRRRMLRRLAFQLSDRVFSVSYHLRERLVEMTGFPAKRVDVIHNGVDTSRFRPQPSRREDFRQRRGIGPEEFCLGVLGRLEPVKDIPTLLHALAVLPKEAGKWRLLIAGDGSEAPALKRMCNELPGLSNHVAFLGEIAEIPDFLNALDLYVLPSIYEGISNSLLEAMATGLPVIATATGGNTEVAVDGKSGLLVRVGDVAGLAERLQSLWQDKGTRLQLGLQALDRVAQEFSIDSMVRKYEQLYGAVAARRATL